MLNKSYGYLLNVEPSNLVFLKTYNTEFDEVIITFTDLNGWQLQIQIEHKVNLSFKKTDWSKSLSGGQYSFNKNIKFKAHAKTSFV